MPRFPGPFTNSNQTFLISSARAYSENNHFTGRLRPGPKMCIRYFIFIESKSKVNTHANQVTVEQIEAEAFQREPDSLSKSSKTVIKIIRKQFDFWYFYLEKLRQTI